MFKFTLFAICLAPPLLPPLAVRRSGAAWKLFNMDEYDYDGREKIATGGEGTVFRIYRKEDGKALALKEFDNWNSKLIQKQMDTYNAIKDLGLFSETEIFKTTEGKPFMLMDLIEGKDLLDACIEDGFSPAEIGEIKSQLLQIGKSLESRGIIWSDCKPENIMLQRNPVRLTLIDLGSVAFKSDFRARHHLTFEYASPTKKGMTDKSVSYAIGKMGEILDSCEKKSQNQTPNSTSTGKVSEVFSELLQTSPGKRPSMPDAFHRVNSARQDTPDAPRNVLWDSLRKPESPDREAVRPRNLMDDFSREKEPLHENNPGKENVPIQSSNRKN